MFSHIMLGTNDFARALAFYLPLCSRLGLEEYLREDEHPWVAWRVPGSPRPLFMVSAPFNGEPATVGNGQMVAFLADDRETVRACHALALEYGGWDEGAPGLRPEYHARYYGAYFRDPDGNKLCVVCHAAE
ncbi:MAG: VOC family protein [Rhodospirillum sp.]|nr:VOC family protein [Rhodospirillum sp.]MCF8491279.1 VOC family protein [Rhodospirillum sp.]MCF8501713.1 VOC family protein [Rhodospirillum sp.]